MLHSIPLYTDQRHILATAYRTLLVSGLNGLSGTVTDETFRALRDKFELKNPPRKFLFTSEELEAIYSGLSIMEYEGWPTEAQAEAEAWLEARHEDQQFHPQLGYSPKDKFRAIQKHIREELSAAARR